MKAIVLHQPYAAAIMLGLKRNETRPRPWSHTGDLAICSGKRQMEGADWKLVEQFPEYVWSDEIKYGVVLCVVRMIKCVRSESIAELSDTERQFGNYAPGRFVYLTTDLRRLARPVPVVGRQGPFNLPPEVEAQVQSQL